MPNPKYIKMKHVRRALVANLRVRGNTLRQITEILATEEPGKGGIRNPDTKNPYKYQTIRVDCVWLDAQWMERAKRDTVAFRAEQLAELREARSRAWESGDMAEVRRNLELESRLTGTLAKDRLEITGALKYEMSGNLAPDEF